MFVLCSMYSASMLMQFRATDFQITEPLPNVTFATGRNWAGNIPVDRPGHPNDTLFFWAIEKENGSLTATESTEPWGIWLNGGCAHFPFRNNIVFADSG